MGIEYPADASKAILRVWEESREPGFVWAYSAAKQELKMMIKTNFFIIRGQ
jgi:hypothetical protein